MVIEQAIVKQRFHITVKQAVDGSITFAIESWEQENEQAQNHSTNSKTHPVIGDARKHVLHHLNRLVEI